jgi:tyrosinase
VFQGKGQSGAVRLTAAQRTNACQPLKLNVTPIVVADITPVRAGDTRTFEVPFAPSSIAVTSPRPPEAAVNASVQNGTGRPARLTFRAPDHVNADTTVTFDLVFGSGANSKTITKSVLITGQPLATEDYLDWSPSPARARLTVPGATTPVTVRVENADPATGGQVVFYRAITPGVAPQDTLELTLPANGAVVDFFVAGKFGRASVADKDAVIRMVDVASGTVMATKALMVRIRKNANALTAAERDRFIAAFATFNDEGRGRFADFRNAHTNAGSPQAHGNHGFLSWHRAFMLDLERELQAIDPSVTLPYWKWDDPAPNLFTRHFIGVADALGAVEFDSANRFSTWATDGVVGVTRRPRFNTTTEAALAMNEVDTLNLGDPGDLFSNFTSLEGDPHGSAHTSFVGLISSIDTAARDPLFFLLHCNVDRLWAKWQWVNRRFDANDAATYEFRTPGATDIGHNLDDTMWPWNGITGGARPPTAPGGTLATSPLGVAQVPTPTVREMVDFQGVIALANRLGFGYDDVPFEV